MARNAAKQLHYSCSCPLFGCSRQDVRSRSITPLKLPSPAAPPCSASVLQLAFPASLLVLLLHGSLWGGAPPGPVGALEAAAVAGAVVAGGTEVWKILEGFQG